MPPAVLNGPAESAERAAMQHRTDSNPGTSGAPVPAAHLRLKRAYEPAAPEDGVRILVDRLWPRGISKAKAALKENDDDVEMFNTVVSANTKQG